MLLLSFFKKGKSFLLKTEVKKPISLFLQIFFNIKCFSSFNSAFCNQICGSNFSKLMLKRNEKLDPLNNNESA